jgi:hypothetical protein
MSFSDFADILRMTARGNRDRIFGAVVQATNLAKDDAVARIGHPQKGWAPLQQATIDEKERLGYDITDSGNPLLRTGEYRDSIHATYNIVSLSGWVSSDDPVAKYHEFGTVHMPPRPVIGPAMDQGAQFLVQRLIKIGQEIGEQLDG